MSAWVVVPVEALRVAEQTCDIASDWHLPDVDVKVPAEWNVPCNEEGWPTTHGLAMYFRGLAARPTGPDVPVVCPVGHTTIDASELEALRRDAERYRELNTPEIADFLAAVEREALHQRDRWAAEHDAGKTDADWFWLIGYLAGKAINKPDKILHHIITTAAACLNWHAAKLGASNVMRPGIAQEKAG